MASFCSSRRSCRSAGSDRVAVIRLTHKAQSFHRASIHFTAREIEFKLGGLSGVQRQAMMTRLRQLVVAGNLVFRFCFLVGNACLIVCVRFVVGFLVLLFFGCVPDRLVVPVLVVALAARMADSQTPCATGTTACPASGGPCTMTNSSCQSPCYTCTTILRRCTCCNICPPVFPVFIDASTFLALCSCLFFFLRLPGWLFDRCDRQHNVLSLMLRVSSGFLSQYVVQPSSR